MKLDNLKDGNYHISKYAGYRQISSNVYTVQELIHALKEKGYTIKKAFINSNSCSTVRFI